MTTEPDLRAAVDALGDAVAVYGCGAAGRAAVERLVPADPPDTESESEPLVAPEEGATPDAPEGAASVLVGVELGAATEAAASRLTRARERGATAVAVAAVPERGPGRAEWRALDGLRDAADAVLLVAADVADEHGPAAGIATALRALLALVERVGVVNLDLADVHTVLSAGDLALLTRAGAAADADPATVVERAVASAPPGVGLGRAPTVLVHVVCGPALSVTGAGAVVDAVREQVAPDAHVIWGATVDDALAEAAVGVDLVVGGVAPAVEAGDPCPRCGAAVVEYTLGERSTVACDDCGYAGVTTMLR